MRNHYYYTSKEQVLQGNKKQLIATEYTHRSNVVMKYTQVIYCLMIKVRAMHWQVLTPNNGSIASLALQKPEDSKRLKRLPLSSVSQSKILAAKVTSTHFFPT